MDKEGTRLLIQEVFGTGKLMQVVRQATCLTASTKAYFITIEAFNPSRIRAIYTPNAGDARIYVYQLDDFRCFRGDKLKQLALKKVFNRHAKY